MPEPVFERSVIEPLASRVVENVTMCPTHRRPDHPGLLYMGVFDSSGNLIPGSLLDRRSGEHGAAFPAEEIEIDASAYLPEAIYCGPLYHHFGHFLLESLARVWYASQRPDLPLLWAGASIWATDPPLRSWQREILDILGVTNPCSVATTARNVGRLHIPDIGYRYDDWFHPQHADFLARYQGPPQSDSVRLWLSRSKLAKDVRDFNARPLERRLESAGWHVVHPEQLSVRCQLDTLARASVIAGEEGSAFHALMLLNDVRGKKLHVMRRLGGEHRNMRTVGDALGLDQSFHTLTDEVVVKAKGRYVTKVSAGPSEVLDILGVPVDSGTSDETSPGTEVVVELAGRLSATSLLEVGVESATAIAHSAFSRATAVSETFSFDPRAHATESARFFELSIEQYLAAFGDWGGYDLVRVAVASPTSGVRAVVATQALASRDCVWVLHLPEPAEGAAQFLHLLNLLLPALVVRTFTHGGSRHAVARLGGVVRAAPPDSLLDPGLALPVGTVESLQDLEVTSPLQALEEVTAEVPSRRATSVDPAVARLVSENRELRRRLRRLRAAQRRGDDSLGGLPGLMRRWRR